MTQIGNKQIGFFYMKDKETFCEMGGTYTVQNRNEYATTSTGNMVLLVDENGTILDMDDVPSEESAQRCGKNFVAFVRDSDTFGFVIGENLFDLVELEETSSGAISSLEVISEDFTLKAHFDLDNTIHQTELKEGELLLIYTDAEPLQNKAIKEITLLQAMAKIVKLGEWKE